MEAAEYNPISGNLFTSTNYQEYFLQGSIFDTEIHKLLDRLQGKYGIDYIQFCITYDCATAFFTSKYRKANLGILVVEITGLCVSIYCAEVKFNTFVNICVSSLAKIQK